MSIRVEPYKLEIKLAARADFEDIWNLVKNNESVKDLYTTPYELMQRAAFGAQIFFVARDGEQNGSLLGVGSLIRQQQSGVAVISDLVLQRGISNQEIIKTALLTQIVQESKTLGIRKLYSYVRTTDPSTSITLIKLGFLPEGRLSNHFRDGTEAIIYGLKL